jgi:hypothetical protein
MSAGHATAEGRRRLEPSVTLCVTAAFFFSFAAAVPAATTSTSSTAARAHRFILRCPAVLSPGYDWNLQCCKVTIYSNQYKIVKAWGIEAHEQRDGRQQSPGLPIRLDPQ